MEAGISALPSHHSPRKRQNQSKALMMTMNRRLKDMTSLDILVVKVKVNGQVFGTQEIQERHIIKKEGDRQNHPLFEHFEYMHCMKG